MKQIVKSLQLLVTIALLLAISTALAQSGEGPTVSNAGGYDLDWHTVDGGGSTFSDGGGYTLSGTAGQPDAGVLGRDGYTLFGGFWGPAAKVRVFLPLVLRGG
jgi:hypothetical protein